MGDEHVEFVKAAGVEQKVDPFARGQFALFVLRVDRRLTAAQHCRCASLAQFFDSLARRHNLLLLPLYKFREHAMRALGVDEDRATISGDARHSVEHGHACGVEARPARRRYPATCRQMWCCPSPCLSRKRPMLLAGSSGWTNSIFAAIWAAHGQESDAHALGWHILNDTGRDSQRVTIELQRGVDVTDCQCDMIDPPDARNRHGFTPSAGTRGQHALPTRYGSAGAAVKGAADFGWDTLVGARHRQMVTRPLTLAVAPP